MVSYVRGFCIQAPDGKLVKSDRRDGAPYFGTNEQYIRDCYYRQLDDGNQIVPVTVVVGELSVDQLNAVESAWAGGVEKADPNQS